MVKGMAALLHLRARTFWSFAILTVVDVCAPLAKPCWQGYYPGTRELMLTKKVAPAREWGHLRLRGISINTRNEGGQLVMQGK